MVVCCVGMLASASYREIFEEALARGAFHMVTDDCCFNSALAKDVDASEFIGSGKGPILTFPTRALFKAASQMLSEGALDPIKLQKVRFSPYHSTSIIT